MTPTLPPQASLPAPLPAIVPLPVPLPSQLLVTSVVRTNCHNQPCMRAAHRSCSSQMCKKCCIIRMGGCHLADHKMERLSARQQEKFQVAPVKVVTPYPSVAHTLPQIRNPFPPSPTLEVLDGLYASDPTSVFLEQQGRINEAKRVEEQWQLELEVLEEVDYQMAVAQSLELPYIAPATSSSSSLFTLVGTTTPSNPSTPTPICTIPHNTLNITQHMNEDWMRAVTTPSNPSTPTPICTIPHNALNITQHMNEDWMRAVTTPSNPSTPTPIRTIPHNTLNITQHMNKDWMRPVEDKTKMPRRLNWEGGGNCFTIVFWDQVRILLKFLFE